MRSRPCYRHARVSIALFKYLQLLSSTTSDSSDKDSLVASQPRKVVSLVPAKGNARGESCTKYIKLLLEKKEKIG